MADDAQRIELFDEYRETGFDGKYEHTTYYRLIVDRANGTATLEVKKADTTVSEPCLAGLASTLSAHG